MMEDQNAEVAWKLDICDMQNDYSALEHFCELFVFNGWIVIFWIELDFYENVWIQD